MAMRRGAQAKTAAPAPAPNGKAGRTKPAKTKTPQTALAVPGNASEALAQYDPEVQKLLREAANEERRELKDLNKDAGLPRLNLKSADDEMEVAILATHRAHAWWEESFNPNDSGAPDCSSQDGETGTGRRVLPDGEEEEGERSCSSCPLNQFGSAEGGKAKACRNVRVLYIQRLGQEVPNPEMLVVPPTGLKPAANYLKSLMNSGLPRFAMVTRITKVESDRSPMGEFHFESAGPVSPEDMKIVAPLAKVYKDLTKRVVVFTQEDASTGDDTEAASGY